jgi:hypothetical protein
MNEISAYLYKYPFMSVEELAKRIWEERGGDSLKNWFEAEEVYWTQLIHQGTVGR